MSASYEIVTEELCDFIAQSPTCFHVVKNAEEILEKAGYRPLQEHEAWNLERGGAYYVTRSDSSLIAFSLPQEEASAFRIIASHSDSPTFKIKENPEIRKGPYVELNVEKYGGMLCAPWFDRPLSIAGRVMTREKEGIRRRLLNLDRDLVMLPSLAIHMDREANEKASYKVQSQMLPIFGDETAEDGFLSLLAGELGLDREDILGMDLFLYDRSISSVWGCHNEFFSSPRLDDLQSAYASLRAMAKGERGTGSGIRVCCIFDNEEVGSLTKQGADSTFLADVLDRICQGLGLGREARYRMIANSFLLSADNAHAVHPNHMDKADPVNRPSMNGGPVIKFHAGQKYTTDGVSAAIFRQICERAGVPTQVYVNHSDLAGGSTLGNLSNAHVSMNAVDIGCAQLAMHSPYETAGVKDTWYMMRAMEAFYETEIRRDSEGGYRLFRHNSI